MYWQVNFVPTQGENVPNACLIEFESEEARDAGQGTPEQKEFYENLGKFIGQYGNSNVKPVSLPFLFEPSNLLTECI